MSNTKHQFERREKLLQLLEKKRSKQELFEKLNNFMQKEYDRNVSLRTLEGDLEYLREDMGIEFHPYSKAEPYYVLTEAIERKVRFNDEERDTLRRSLQILLGIQGVALAGRLKQMLDKASLGLLDEQASERVAFENHNLAEGTQYLDNLLEAVNEETALQVTYTGFSDNKRQEFVFSPYFLKEYRNRWYAIGLNHSTGTIYNLGLDRMQGLRNTTEAFVPNISFDPAEYFNCLIGVTRPAEQEQPMDIELRISKTSAPYVLSKKIIGNQQLLKEYKNGDILIRIRAYNNYELRQNLLAFGDALLVLKPASLAQQMQDILHSALKGYAKKQG